MLFIVLWNNLISRLLVHVICIFWTTWACHDNYVVLLAATVIAWAQTPYQLVMDRPILSLESYDCHALVVILYYYTPLTYGVVISLQYQMMITMHDTGRSGGDPEPKL